MPLRKKSKADRFQLDDDVLERIGNEFPDAEETSQKQKKSRRRLKRFLFRLTAVCGGIIVLNLAVLYFCGALRPNEPRKRDYPTRGAVLSSDNGKLNVKKLEHQNLSFVYVRAGKGTSFEDKQFEQSWEDLQQSSLMSGAVHDFDFSADGKAQAESFISLVGSSFDGRLIPAVDITLNWYERIIYRSDSSAAQELGEFIETLIAQYGSQVFVICDKRSYDGYHDVFEGQPVWAVSVSSDVSYCDDWAVWEYSDRGNIEGCENSDKHCSLLVGAQDVTPESFFEKYSVK